MSEKRDYYEVLGVEKNASSSDLKNAFRRLARKFHPDRSTEDNAEEKFKEIQEAYAVLSDDQKRSHYDRFGHDGPSGSPFGGFGGGGFGINLEDILGGDFFSNIFGGSRTSRRREQRGADVLLRHTIQLRDVVDGTEQEVILDLPESCNQCQGTGAENGILETCTTCQGAGQQRIRQQVGPFIQESIQPCNACRGRGQHVESSCRSCQGTGHEMKSNTIRFSVPLGAEHGTRLRMRGKGEPGPFGQGSPGDLFVELEIESHPWLERSNSDLIMSLPLGYDEFVLGTRIELDHIDGKPLVIEVPSMSNSGDTVEIRKRGLPRQRGSGRGDVIVLLKLHMPRKISKSAKKALASISNELQPENHVQSVIDDAKSRRQSS